ncbi:MAG: hypothetical protein P4M02_04980, partial [Clostridia bacterium]|nr:hypothetical protein [Clostridia bacterium]
GNDYAECTPDFHNGSILPFTLSGNDTDFTLEGYPRKNAQSQTATPLRVFTGYSIDPSYGVKLKSVFQWENSIIRYYHNSKTQWCQ